MAERESIKRLIQETRLIVIARGMEPQRMLDAAEARTAVRETTENSSATVRTRDKIRFFICALLLGVHRCSYSFMYYTKGSRKKQDYFQKL